MGNNNCWWKETCIYQIYPRSFQDSNNDGIGDLQGIISKLDYIKDLGFETIWISPFFKSPQRDFGYDISDYTEIAPEYGTMEDCDRLIEEVHRRGMKIILDMVMNHTSDEHPWFLESSSSRDNPKRDWYVWRDGRKPGKAPTNWLSQVKGNGWQYHKETDQWYWAAFLPFQPDLNYRNPEVKETMFNIIRFWLDKGVDGFRLDIIGALFEDEEFRDNPFSFQLVPTGESSDKMFRSTKMVENLPETIEFTKELRAVLDEYDNRFLIGETFGSLKDLREFTGEMKPDGLHATFLFNSIYTPFRAPALKKMIRSYEEYFPDPWIPSYVFANHDSMRRMTTLRGNEKKIRLQTLLQHTARGIPVSYYGEEIGMKQSKFPRDKALDPVSHEYSFLPDFLFNLVGRLTHGSLNRDECRTPHQWDASPFAGFSEKKSWLPVGKDKDWTNVYSQSKDPASLLNFYKAVLMLRSTSTALKKGKMTLLDAERHILAYTRSQDGETLSIYMNISAKSRTVALPEPAGLLLSTEFDRKKEEVNELILAPWEGVVLG
ncbi:MAG: alpha-glucosidase [Spirochaetales bacterium]|nr:alpha-glucosidase [Spirochaetales bacterium]